MSPQLRAAIRTELGFSELFPVQAAVWRELAGGASSAHDACVCAPTGSGKTLAYALPLLSRVAAGRPQIQGRADPASRLLTGLVVVPTRDLAVQVHKTLAALSPSLGLSCALAAAQATVAAEAAAAVGRPSVAGSGCDVLVATPGRLVAHLQGTPGFSLRHVCVLVVDEADRLLRQDYQNWLPEVLRQISPTEAAREGSSRRRHELYHHQQQHHQQQQHHHHHQQQQQQQQQQLLLPYGEERPLKLVVSATLTRDPTKLSRLQLHRPRFISLAELGGRRHALPPGLELHRVVAPARHKPLALVALLRRLAGVQTLVFASSVETTHRLYLLLAALPCLPGRVVECAGNLAPPQRARSLADFRSGRAGVLVASDAVARGMDVEGVGAVINYDAPVYPKVFVHRAGRTARAGRSGAVYTLLRPEDVRHFKAVASKLSVPPPPPGAAGASAASAAAGGGAAGKELKIPQEELAPLRPALAAALQEVQELLAAERDEDAAREGRPGGGGGGGGGVRGGGARGGVRGGGGVGGGGGGVGGGGGGGEVDGAGALAAAVRGGVAGAASEDEGEEEAPAGHKLQRSMAAAATGDARGQGVGLEAADEADRTGQHQQHRNTKRRKQGH